VLITAGTDGHSGTGRGEPLTSVKHAGSPVGALGVAGRDVEQTVLPGNRAPGPDPWAALDGQNEDRAVK